MLSLLNAKFVFEYEEFGRTEIKENFLMMLGSELEDTVIINKFTVECEPRWKHKY